MAHTNYDAPPASTFGTRHAQKTITNCPFCGRSTDAEAVTCGRYRCDPDLDEVLDVFGVENLYLKTNYHGNMVLYHDVRRNSIQDECVWSATKDDRIIGLLERLGVDRW